MTRQIDSEACIGCGKCEKVCLVGCISHNETRIRTINQEACVGCGACQLTCPKKCININELIIN